jgi:hypothetical protein
MLKYVREYNSSENMKTKLYDGLILKVYDDNNWEVITVDAIMDTLSYLAIKSFNRPVPPLKP